MNRKFFPPGNQAPKKSLDELLKLSAPFDEESERSFLGSILLDPTIAPAAARELEPKHFYSPARRKVFEVIRSIVNDNAVVDAMLIHTRMLLNGDGAELGGHGLQFFADLVENLPIAANWKWYARRIVDTFKLRQVIYATTEVIREAHEPSGDDVSAIVSRCTDRLLQTAAKIREATELSDARPFADSFEELERRIKNPEVHRPIGTGWADLDAKLGGWFDKDLIVVAARPSMGKTAFGSQTAMYAAEHGNPTLFVSLEMPRSDLEARIICSRADVSHHQARQGRATPGDLELMRRASGELARARIIFDDRPRQTVAGIAAAARICQQRFGHCALIVIDYLQIIAPSERGMMRDQQITEIATGLKDLAKNMEVPVIALAQLKREVEKEKDMRPRLSHLRESGGIEQAADVVVLLHRDEYYHPGDNAVRGKADFIIAKQRLGPAGVDVKMRWDGRGGMFYDLSHRFGPGDDSYDEQVEFEFGEAASEVIT